MTAASNHSKQADSNCSELHPNDDKIVTGCFTGEENSSVNHLVVKEKTFIFLS